MMKTVNEFVAALSSQHTGDLPQLDVQLILAHVLDKPRTWIAAHGDAHLTDPQIDSVQKEFARLQAGEPLPYILGHWEFFGLDFDITKDVLIPRPETELLVEKAISHLQATTRQNPDRGKRVADIGTGSGAIAISIAMHMPSVRIFATDISRPALEVAKRNAEKFHVHHQIEFVECDLLPANNNEQLTFDLICANLPYIPTDTLHRLPIFGREPTLALDGGADGLDLYRRLFQLSTNRLAPRGVMLLEIESTLGVQTLGLAFDTFSNATLHLHQDLAGNDRLLEIMLK
jgi:release factor glutamine methyltransferase